MQGKRHHVLERTPAFVHAHESTSAGRPPVVAGPESQFSRSAPHHLVGVSPDALLATVEGLEADLGRRWMLWGSVRGRPILFWVEARGGREMLDAVAGGDEAVAIVEPWELVGQPLD